ncbi:MAG: SH3 domain-containing protein [Thiobacillus sp.]|nr:SH3 domain-containing protein [Thiobacillus sp.]
MKTSLIPAAALVLCVASATAWAAPGTVLRNEKLYSQPSASASVTANVSKGANVEILAKQGGWLRVKAGNSTGWIRLLSVRAGAGGLGGTGVGDVVGAATTRSDPSRVVAVAGLRGLNDEDLKRAQFNADELARLDAMKVTTAQARSHARQSGLVAVKVAELPKPQPEQSSSPWGNN